MHINGNISGQDEYTLDSYTVANYEGVYKSNVPGQEKGRYITFKGIDGLHTFYVVFDIGGIPCQINMKPHLAAMNRYVKTKHEEVTLIFKNN